MTKRTEAQTEAIESLRELLPAGTVVYTLIRSVASSGMSRRISVFVVRDGELVDLDWRIHRSGIAKRRGNDKEGLFMSGVGMDMAFALTYNLGMALHDDGYSFTKRDI